MEAFIFHMDTGEWRQVQEGMSSGRRNAPICGLVDTGSEKYVVVAGGDNRTCTCHQYDGCDNHWYWGCCLGQYECVGDGLTSVETFSLEDETWQRGKVKKNELVVCGHGM